MSMFQIRKATRSQRTISLIQANAARKLSEFAKIEERAKFINHQMRLNKTYTQAVQAWENRTVLR